MKQIVEAQCKSCMQESDCKGCDIHSQAMEAFNKQAEEDLLDEIQEQVEQRFS